MMAGMSPGHSMSHFIFTNSPELYKKDFVQWLDIPTSFTEKREFISFMENELTPNVGGENWDSLESNFNDDEIYEKMSIGGKRIIVLNHRDLPKLDQENILIYLKILNKTILFSPTQKNFKNNAEDIAVLLDGISDLRGIIVLFPVELKGKVEKYHLS